MTEIFLAEGSLFHIHENDHGFRVTRLADGEQCTFYGDDNCERFRDHFTGDEFPDDPTENKDEADEFGAWCVEAGELGPLKHEYAFDMSLTAAMRVKATSQQEALAMLRAALDCADANLGAWPNGDPILAEVSCTSAHLYEIDGQEVPK